MEMKIKVVMDSGKEYIIKDEHYSVDDFTNFFYNDLPTGVKTMKNSHVYLDRDETIFVNPTHISSIEVLEK